MYRSAALLERTLWKELCSISSPYTLLLSAMCRSRRQAQEPVPYTRPPRGETLMFEIRRCIAPRCNLPQLECGNEFKTLSMNQIYCYDTCRNRAQKHPKLRRKRGYVYGLGAQAARIANPPTAYNPQKIIEAQLHTSIEHDRAIALA